LAHHLCELCLRVGEFVVVALLLGVVAVYRLVDRAVCRLELSDGALEFGNALLVLRCWDGVEVGFRFCGLVVLCLLLEDL
jgi:hypothetical protein